jgi:hypothetical protein
MLTGAVFPNRAPIESGISRSRFKPNNRDTELVPLSQTEYDQLTNGGAYVAVYGIIVYEDVFSVSHFTTFCQWKAFRPGSYTAAKCTDYNNVDNN